MREREKKILLDVRRGIPLALFVVFSSALIFQLVLFAYISSLLARAGRTEALTAINALASRTGTGVKGRPREGVSEGGASVKTFPHLPALQEYLNRMGEEVPAVLEGGAAFISKSGETFFIVPEGGRSGRFILVSVPQRFDSFKVFAVVGGVSVTYIIVLFVFILHVFTKYVSRPLGHLVEAVERFEEGGEVSPPPDIPDNELARLAEVLVSAFSRIREKQGELEETVSALKRANEELTRSRQQLIRVEKLATVGRLASGIAHEVGNPLASIKGYAEYLLDSSELTEEQRECLERLLKESVRIEGILKGLLQHSRGKVEGPGETDVNRLVEDILSALSYRKLSERVEVVTRFSPVPPALIDEDRLRQVLLNVILNAFESMPDGGRLTVRTFFREVEEPSPPRRRRTDPPDADFTLMRKGATRVLPDTSKGRVVIEVEDTGGGIPEEDLEKIFDPFYTTKEPGKGTGLGLSISSAILDSYDGFIEVESRVGEGSLFRIVLPASKRRSKED